MGLRSFWVALCALPLLLTACAYPSGTPAAPGPDTANGDPRGSSWLLEDLRGAPPVAGTAVTATFGTDGRVAGSAGCNSYGASFTLAGDRLTISDAMSTQMACMGEGIMEQESAFLRALEDVRTYRSTHERLELRDDAGAAILTFAVTSQDLADTSWIITNLYAGNAVTSVLNGTEATVSFTADGVSASAGCNQLRGAATFGEGTIKLGPVAGTRKLCPTPEGLMEQEAQLIAALERATSYRVEGNTLRLMDGETTMLSASRA